MKIIEITIREKIGNKVETNNQTMTEHILMNYKQFYNLFLRIQDPLGAFPDGPTLNKGLPFSYPNHYPFNRNVSTNAIYCHVILLPFPTYFHFLRLFTIAYFMSVNLIQYVGRIYGRHAIRYQCWAST